MFQHNNKTLDPSENYYCYYYYYYYLLLFIRLDNSHKQTDIPCIIIYNNIIIMNSGDGNGGCEWMVQDVSAKYKNMSSDINTGSDKNIKREDSR